MAIAQFGSDWVWLVLDGDKLMDDFLNETRQADHGPWRLPNIRELESLVDDKKHSPAFADGFFINIVKDGYWSSTTSLYEPRYAWVLYPLDGAIGVGYKPNTDFYVLAVHG